MAAGAHRHVAAAGGLHRAPRTTGSPGYHEETRESAQASKDRDSGRATASASSDRGAAMGCRLTAAAAAVYSAADSLASVVVAVEPPADQQG